MLLSLFVVLEKLLGMDESVKLFVLVKVSILIASCQYHDMDILLT